MANRAGFSDECGVFGVCDSEDAANLAYLFTERPLLERFGAAAAAGFKAVELQFPYDQSPSAVKAELEKHGLTQLGVNTAVGGRDGDAGLAAVSGRESDWDAVFKQALDYTVAIGGKAIHCMTGKALPACVAAPCLASLTNGPGATCV